MESRKARRLAPGVDTKPSKGDANMRHRLLTVVATGIAIGFAVFAAAPAAAAPPPQTQELKLSGDPRVTESNSLTLIADRIKKRTLAQACFTFTFVDNPVDLGGSGLTITPDGSPTEGPGFEPISFSPRTLCVDDPTFLVEIADGDKAEQFVVRAHPGAFTVLSVTMTLTYA
jgi:hypothetical protein